MRTSFQVTRRPPDALVHLAGELDLACRDRLAAVLRGLHSQACDRLSIDLRDVTFVDAHTLRILDDERLRLERAGGTLRVVAASDACLLVTGLAGYDRLQPSPDEAPRPRHRQVVLHRRSPSSARTA